MQQFIIEEKHTALCSSDSYHFPFITPISVIKSKLAPRTELRRSFQSCVTQYKPYNIINDPTMHTAGTPRIPATILHKSAMADEIDEGGKETSVCFPQVYKQISK
mmetsp:Transcript_10564/g.16911  ORF Transcript_10564/g.16911 Transcript_10564/m.16911 type:complete len:105 (+) Transcript_10564:320-634(+)